MLGDEAAEGEQAAGDGGQRLAGFGEQAGELRHQHEGKNRHEHGAGADHEGRIDHGLGEFFLQVVQLGHAGGHALEHAGQAAGRLTGGDQRGVKVVEAGRCLAERRREGFAVLEVQAGAGAGQPDGGILLFFGHHGERLLHRQAGLQQVGQFGGEKDEFGAAQPGRAGGGGGGLDGGGAGGRLLHFQRRQPPRLQLAVRLAAGRGIQPALDGAAVGSERLVSELWHLGN